MAKYDLQIELLERLIHNWYDIKTPDDFYKVFPEYTDGVVKYFRSGLCYVCKIKNVYTLDRWDMFSDWSYSKDVVFPVGKAEEYYKIKLITDNPKRLHLAVHCLQWLRQRNIEEVGEVT